jgi:hypothetical protein
LLFVVYKFKYLLLDGSHSVDRGVAADLFDVVKDYRINALIFTDRPVILGNFGLQPGVDYAVDLDLGQSCF